MEINNHITYSRTQVVVNAISLIAIRRNLEINKYKKPPRGIN